MGTNESALIPCSSFVALKSERGAGTSNKIQGGNTIHAIGVNMFFQFSDITYRTGINGEKVKV